MEILFDLIAYPAFQEYKLIILAPGMRSVIYKSFSLIIFVRLSFVFEHNIAARIFIESFLRGWILEDVKSVSIRSLFRI